MDSLTQIRYSRGPRPNRNHRRSSGPVVFGPLHYEPKYNYPLLVWLHDVSENEWQLNYIMPSISLRNYVAIAPRWLPGTPARRQSHTVPRDGIWPRDAKTAEFGSQAVIDSVSAACSRYTVASNRIFLAGRGAGGSMALLLALENPRRFAGVASFGGPLPRRGTPFAEIEDARRLPVYMAVARNARSAPNDSWESDIHLLHAAGIRATICEYDTPNEVGSCGVTQIMLADFNRWMMRIVCNDRVPTI